MARPVQCVRVRTGPLPGLWHLLPTIGQTCSMPMRVCRGSRFERGPSTPCVLAAVMAVGLAMSSCSATDEAGVDGLVMRHIDAPSGDGEAAEVRGLIEISGDCLYVSLEEIGERYPVVWPRGTSWDAENQAVVLVSGESIAAGDAVYGGGGYRDVNDVGQWAGSEAAALAKRCVDNAYGEVAVVNNTASGIGPAE